jgi:hypothetical protein
MYHSLSGARKQLKVSIINLQLSIPKNVSLDEMDCVSRTRNGR